MALDGPLVALPAYGAAPMRPLPWLLAAAVALAACGSGGGDAGPSSTASPTTAASTVAPPTTVTTTVAPPTTAATTTVEPPAPAGPTAFVEPGPFPVGTVELELGPGRPLTVWYPAEPGSEAGVAPATYDMRTYLPPDLQAVVGGLPVEDTSYTTAAFPDLPGAATDEPFPTVLFSHGFAGYRTQSTFLTAHLASWGFVVAAPQHTSRDLASVLSGGATAQGAPPDTEDLVDALAVLEAAHLRDDDNPLATRVDTDLVAAVGHSAGGGAAYRLAGADPRVDTYVALAAPPALGREGQEPPPVPPQPSLYVAGSADVIASLERIEQGWSATVPPTTRLAVIDDVTHLGFMEICEIAVEQGGVLNAFASVGGTIPEVISRLFADGCDPKYTAATDARPAIDHLTTAQVRWGLGIDAATVGLDEAVETAYAPLVVRLETKL